MRASSCSLSGKDFSFSHSSFSSQPFEARRYIIAPTCLFAISVNSTTRLLKIGFSTWVTLKLLSDMSSCNILSRLCNSSSDISGVSESSQVQKSSWCARDFPIEKVSHNYANIAKLFRSLQFYFLRFWHHIIKYSERIRYTDTNKNHSEEDNSSNRTISSKILRSPSPFSSDSVDIITILHHGKSCTNKYKSDKEIHSII